jgi:hypothetical protein
MLDSAVRRASGPAFLPLLLAGAMSYERSGIGGTATYFGDVAEHFMKLQLSSEWEVFNSTVFGGFPDCRPASNSNCPRPSVIPARLGIAVRTECTVCPQRVRSSPSQIRVACVGDSLTAGLEASSQRQSYPMQLQAMLGDAYVVTNLGSSGATAQNCSRPKVRAFQRTAMYRSFMASKWDLVVICERFARTNISLALSASGFVSG